MAEAVVAEAAPGPAGVAEAPAAAPVADHHKAHPPPAPWDIVVQPLQPSTAATMTTPLQDSVARRQCALTSTCESPLLSLLEYCRVRAGQRFPQAASEAGDGYIAPVAGHSEFLDAFC